MNNKPSITFKFNLVLFTYLCVDFLVSIIFDPKIDEKVPWDTLYEAFPVFSIILAVFISLLLLLWGAKLLELFWNKLISDIFKIRVINFQEALALVLILAIVVA